jgi:hypothetical protein
LDDVADFLSAPLATMRSAGGSYERHGAAERLRGFSRLFAGLAHTELCIICGGDTAIPVSCPVDQRRGYIEGVGQCCEACGQA